jgi:hypothetical protein
LLDDLVYPYQSVVAFPLCPHYSFYYFSFFPAVFSVCCVFSVAPGYPFVFVPSSCVALRKKLRKYPGLNTPLGIPGVFLLVLYKCLVSIQRIHRFICGFDVVYVFSVGHHDYERAASPLWSCSLIIFAQAILWDQLSFIDCP